MTWIKNNAVRAGELVGKIDQKTNVLELRDNASRQQAACTNISAEIEGDRSYQDGKEWMIQLQHHL